MDPAGAFSALPPSRFQSQHAEPGMVLQDQNKFGPVKWYTDNQTKTARDDTPNNWFQHYMIGVDGLCSIYDPPVSYWCSEHTAGGGAFAFRTPNGVTAGKEAFPNSPYKSTSDALMFVWRPARWANWMFEIGVSVHGCSLVCVWLWSLCRLCHRQNVSACVSETLLRTQDYEPTTGNFSFGYGGFQVRTLTGQVTSKGSVVGKSERSL